MLDKETCSFDETAKFVRNCKHCCSAASCGWRILQSLPCCWLSCTSSCSQVQTCSLWNDNCASNTKQQRVTDSRQVVGIVSGASALDMNGKQAVVVGPHSSLSQMSDRQTLHMRVDLVLSQLSVIDSSVKKMVGFACQWNQCLCLQTPPILFLTLARSCGLDPDCFRMVIFLCTQRMVWPQVLMGLSCQMMLQVIPSHWASRERVLCRKVFCTWASMTGLPPSKSQMQKTLAQETMCHVPGMVSQTIDILLLECWLNGELQTNQSAFTTVSRDSLHQMGQKCGHGRKLSMVCDSKRQVSELILSLRIVSLK